MEVFNGGNIPVADQGHSIRDDYGIYGARDAGNSIKDGHVAGPSPASSRKPQKMPSAVMVIVVTLIAMIVCTVITLGLCLLVGMLLFGYHKLAKKTNVAGNHQ